MSFLAKKGPQSSQDCGPAFLPSWRPGTGSPAGSPYSVEVMDLCIWRATGPAAPTASQELIGPTPSHALSSSLCTLHELSPYKADVCRLKALWAVSDFLPGPLMPYWETGSPWAGSRLPAPVLFGHFPSPHLSASPPCYLPHLMLK